MEQTALTPIQALTPTFTNAIAEAKPEIMKVFTAGVAITLVFYGYKVLRRAFSTSAK